jgi:uncharacterized tellurite resistance protein B-like protein
MGPPLSPSVVALHGKHRGIIPKSAQGACYRWSWRFLATDLSCAITRGSRARLALPINEDETILGVAMLFIIWGWRARTKELRTGTFHCPNEGGDRPFALMEARRWFTLFFLPVIPLAVLGEYVECSTCRATYDPRVLTAPTTAEIEDTVTRAIRHVVVDMIKADGEVHDDEVAAAVAVVRRFVKVPYTEADLRRDLIELDSSRTTRTQLGTFLTDVGREAVLSACLELAFADGAIDDSELSLIAGIGSDLGMSPAHVRGVVDEATARYR